MPVDQIAINAPAAPPRGEFATGPGAGDEARGPFGADGFTFADLVDIINPLQHIPLVSTIYRELTGDEIATGPRVLGGGLFGGVIGAVFGLINAALESNTGKDIGGHVVAMMRGGPEEAEPVVAAAASPAPGATSGTGRADPAEAALAARAYAARLAAPEIGQVREEWP